MEQPVNQILLRAEAEERVIDVFVWLLTSEQKGTCGQRKIDSFA